MRGMKTWLPSLQPWVMAALTTPWGRVLLQVVVCLESAILFVPVDVVVAALVVNARWPWWATVVVSVVSSVLGGMLGYMMGVLIWDQGGSVMASLYGRVEVLADGSMDFALPVYLHEVLGGTYFFQVYKQWTIWIVAIFALTPLPYRVAAVVSGMAASSWPIFLAGSLLGRGLRFALVGYLAHRLDAYDSQRFQRAMVVIMLVAGLLVISWLVVHGVRLLMATS